MKMDVLYLKVNIHERELEVERVNKYIGTHLDNSLDWNDQVRSVFLKASRGHGLPCQAKTSLPFSAVTILNANFVEPYCRYCCSVWSFVGATKINRLQKLQNGSTWTVANRSFDVHSR